MTKKITQLTEDTSPSLLDMLETAKSPDGTPLSRKVRQVYLATLSAPDGVLVNGKISVTVSSNNLIVAIKGADGTDPSATNPVGVRIAGTARMITAALSVTISAGTNTFNAGGNELQTVETDYFVYLSWKAASSAVVILVSRLPWAVLYSDFSTTATVEKYGAYSSQPANSDDVVVAGRFAATLSAGAGFTWTVPTFTSLNLVQKPIFETRWLAWNPVFAGFATPPTGTHVYKISGKGLSFFVRETTGTSNTTGFTMTLPFAPANTEEIMVRAADNGALLTTPALMEFATFTATLYPTLAGGNWTNASSKYSQGRGTYEI